MQPFSPDIARETRSALGAIKAQGESERYWRINRYEGAFDGLDVDGLPGFWDTSVPLRERAPAIRAQLPKIAARRLVAMLFSDRSFPGVTVDGSGYGVSLDDAQVEALSALIAEIVRAARIPSVMRALAMASMRSGTVVAVTGIRRGLPVVDLLPAKCCTPTFDEDGELTRVEYMQKIPAPGGKWMLHRRVITAQMDTTYQPVDVETLSERTDLDALPIAGTPRALSFLPVVWVRNAPDASLREVDGYPIHHGLLAEITAADMECSQLYRTALYNGEPVMVRMGVAPDASPTPMGPQGRVAAGAVGAEVEHGAASWGSQIAGFARRVFSGGAGATKKAPNIVWNLPVGADVKMLESSGAGAQILTTAFGTHSRVVTDAMGVILAQPGDMGGNAMSSRALAIMFAPMLATVDEMRVSYGDVLRDIVGQLLRWCHVTASGVHVGAIAAARSALAALSVPVGGGTQWMSAAIALQWGEFFEPSWADISAAIDAATKATGGRAVLSQRAAMRLVGPVVGVDDLDAEAEELDRELGGDTAAMKDALGALAPQPDAPAVAPVEAVADTALNGAQIDALVALAEKVALRTLPLESAVRIAIRAFQLSDEEARAMLSPAAEAPPPDAAPATSSPPVSDGPRPLP